MSLNIIVSGIHGSKIIFLNALLLVKQAPIKSSHAMLCYNWQRRIAIQKTITGIQCHAMQTLYYPNVKNLSLYVEIDSENGLTVFNEFS